MTRHATNSILTPSDVARIKRNLREGVTPKECAQAYGLATETVRRIARGETWLHVEEEGAPSEPLPPSPQALASQDLIGKLLSESQILKDRERGTDEALDQLTKETQK